MRDHYLAEGRIYPSFSVAVLAQPNHNTIADVILFLEYCWGKRGDLISGGRLRIEGGFRGLTELIHGHPSGLIQPWTESEIIAACKFLDELSVGTSFEDSVRAYAFEGRATDRRLTVTYLHRHTDSVKDDGFRYVELWCDMMRERVNDRLPPSVWTAFCLEPSDLQGDLINMVLFLWVSSFLSNIFALYGYLDYHGAGHLVSCIEISCGVLMSEEDAQNALDHLQCMGLVSVHYGRWARKVEVDRNCYQEEIVPELTIKFERPMMSHVHPTVN